MSAELDPVIITGREPLDLPTLQEALQWFWKTEHVDAILLIPPELKFKAREIVHQIREENPLAECQYAVIYSFRSASAWLLVSKGVKILGKR